MDTQVGTSRAISSAETLLSELASLRDRADALRSMTNIKLGNYSLPVLEEGTKRSEVPMPALPPFYDQVRTLLNEINVAVMATYRAVENADL